MGTRQDTRPGRAQSGALGSPAMVNFALTRCKPGPAAYEATILDLAARGHLSVSMDSPGLLVARAGRDSDRRAQSGGLVAFEQRVLDDVGGRLAVAESAPFQALAEAVTADVRDIWEPFANELRQEARRAGVCRRRIMARRRNSLLVFAIAALIGGGAFSAVHWIPYNRIGKPDILDVLAWLIRWGVLTRSAARDVLTFSAAHWIHNTRIGGPVISGVLAWLIVWGILTWFAAKDVLTPMGRSLAASRRRSGLAQPLPHDGTPADQESVQQCAFAVAAGLPNTLPGRPAASRRGWRRAPSRPPLRTRRPREAWSSLSGTWRPVPITSTSTMGMAGGVVMLVSAALLVVTGAGLIAAAGISGVPFGLTIAAAVVLAVLGARRVIRTAAMPRRITFDGQVIARWYERSDSEDAATEVPFLAVDDGERAWMFGGAGVFGPAAPADLVRVTASPRNGALIEFTVLASAPRASGPS